MSCSVCRGVRYREAYNPGATIVLECQRTAECVRAAPGYFTRDERIAAGASRASHPLCTSNECQIRQLCTGSAACRHDLERDAQVIAEVNADESHARAQQLGTGRVSYNDVRPQLAADIAAGTPRQCKLTIAGGNGNPANAGRECACVHPSGCTDPDGARHNAAMIAAASVRAKLDRRGRCWRQSYTGRQIWPLDPKPGEFALYDIAHGLGNLTRYGGQANRFYSVAEHSVIVSRYVKPAHALEALMHEIDEAVTGVDMAGPLKSHPMLAGFRAICDRITAAGFEQFGIVSTTASHADVKEIDTRILHDERVLLFGAPPADWHVPGAPLGCEFEWLAPPAATTAFLSRFRELCPEYAGP